MGINLKYRFYVKKENKNKVISHKPLLLTYTEIKHYNSMTDHFYDM